MAYDRPTGRTDDQIRYLESRDDPFARSDWWHPDGFLMGLHELLDPIRIPYISRQLRSAPGGTMLDVGCGGGFVTEAIAEAGYEAVGFDVSPEAVLATRDGPGRGLYAVADAHRLPFDDERFAGVILSEILEHVERAGVVFAEAARVLAPGGVMIVTGPNRTIFSRIALIWLAQNRLLGVLPEGLHEHAKFLRPADIWAWSDSVGLTPRDIAGVGLRPGGVLRAISVIAHLRLGTLTYAEAGRAIRLSEVRSVVIAYMAALEKR